MQCDAAEDTENDTVRGEEVEEIGEGKKRIYAVTEEVGTARKPPLMSCPKQLNLV